MKMLRIAKLVLREALSNPSLERTPEPTAEMDDIENVRAFHAQGAQDGPLLPVYHFNALATSRLLKEGAFVVDLGSGSAQYLAYLAQRRPDIRIVGLELADTMIQVGNEFLMELGLSDRVELRKGDMTDFVDNIAEEVDLVSSVFALHHLPSVEQLKSCIGEIAKILKRDGSAIWIFDHVRPKQYKTAREFPEIFTPEAPDAFRIDSGNSLIASFGFEQMSELLEDALKSSELIHECARFMQLYQVHYCAHRARGGAALDGKDHWSDYVMSPEANKEFKGLSGLFPTLKLG